MARFSLRDLEKRVAQRAKASAKASYTRALLDKGVTHCGKKLREEAGETADAAVDESRKRVVSESADLLYHLIVLLRVKKMSLGDALAVLEKRHAPSK